MDPNFEKSIFLAFLSIELCACDICCFLYIDVSPIILDKASSSRDAK